MVYAFLKVWANWVLRIYFRKVKVHGIENVPEDRALLIASNHPNGFLEPITMACLFPKPLHFLVRGDVFENPIARFWLEQTNQIPIFRFKDGFENLRKNNKSIEISLKKLQEGESILIFVEGGTKAQKRLRPLQKGLSRIAFQVLEKDNDLQLDILPVGMNYFDNRKFRSESILSVGKPMSANTYFQQYRDDVNTGIRTLTKDIATEIKKHVIHLDDLEDTPLLDNMLLLKKAMQKHKALPFINEDNHSLTADKQVANNINLLNKEEKTTWINRSKSIIDKYGYDALLNRYHSTNSMFINLLLLLLLFIPAVTGLVFNAIPFFGARTLALSKASKSIFFMSIWFSAFAILGLVYYFILIMISVLVLGWKGWLVLLALPLFTLSAFWWDRWNEWKSQLDLGKNQKNAYSEMQTLFEELNLKS